MRALIFIMFVLLGLIAGTFLAVQVLLIITVICILVGAFLFWNYRNAELEELIPVIFAVVAAIINGIMWLTYDVSSGKSHFWEFIQHNILR
jgi:hypothetical protein